MSGTTKSVDDELKDCLIELANRHFPKGAHKDRGSAIVLVAEALQLFTKQLEEAEIRARIDEQEMTSSDPDGAIDVGDVTKESWWSSQESRIEYLKAKLAKGGTDDTPRV